MFHKNETHLLYGRRVTSRRPPQPEMTVVLRGVWRLRPGQPLEAITDTIEQGPLRAETVAPEDLERTGPLSYPGDFAEWKPTAEVMLRGTCHVPGGKPLTVCPVRFQVGEWSKTLVCVGPRVWVPGILFGASPSEPQPFLRMPLTWENALGGAAVASNPAGKGVGTELLPTVELQGQLVTSRAQRPPPATFLPVNPLWSPRVDRQGRKYGAAWRRTRAPFHAEDFDWRWCCAAPDDQQLPGYLRGDEDLAFQNLDPQHPTWTARLPGLRPRHFVKDKAGDAREVPLVLDTLFADLEDGRLYLTWRGVTPIATLDMSDVTASLSVVEPLDAQPAPPAEYLARLQQHEDDPLGLAEKVPPDLLPLFLREAGPELAYQRAQLGLPALPAPPPPPAPALPPPQNPLSALLREKLGGARPEQQAQLAALLDPGLARLESQPPDPRLGPPVREQLAAALKRLEQAPPPLAPGAVMAPDGKSPRPRVDLRALSEGLKKTRDQLKQQRLAPPDLAAIDALLVLPESELTPPQGDEEPGADLQGQDLSGQDLRGTRLRGARLQGAKLGGADLRSVDLTGADLSGADLSGAQLMGATLRHALLTRARAAGADLRQAQLEGATLFEADLQDANLEEARLTFAQAGRARLDRACLRRADLTMAVLSEATLVESDLREAVLEMATLERCDLRRADLRRARGKMPLLSRSDLREARLREAVLERGDFERCDLRQADFTGAQLHMASLRGVNAQEARFSGARLTMAVGARGADFTGARLDRIKGRESVWQGANLTRADFSHADLRQAALQGARCDHTRFDAAELSDARMRQLVGEGTRFIRANLCRAELPEARLRRAELLGANCWRAIFLQARLEECDLREANLAGAVREAAPAAQPGTRGDA